MFEQFEKYGKEMRKYNVTLAVLERLVDYQITMTENRYYLGSRKSFPVNSDESTTEVITAETYGNYISSIPFFGDRVTKTYTYTGYIPTKLTCKSPDKQTKVERIFKITKKNKSPDESLKIKTKRLIARRREYKKNERGLIL